MGRSVLLGGLLAASLCLAAPGRAQSGTLDVDLVGGAFSQPTTLKWQGVPGRKYIALISVISAPGINFIPAIATDVGIEFLSWSFVLPGFLGVFDAQGQAQATIVVPPIPELDVFPLYLQLFMTVAGGNQLVDKSTPQTLTMQHGDSVKPPHLGSQHVVARSTHTLTLLDDERVLAAGGGDDGITTSYGQASAELYRLSDEALLATGDLVQPRTGHSATRLLDGRVLFVGGADDVFGEPTNTAEVYDPVTGQFSAVGNLVHGPRALHRANLLPDGRVLITGGTNNYIDPTSILLGAYKSTEIFNPVTNTFSAGPNMKIKRVAQSATSLPNGDVLVSGGYTVVTIIFIELPLISSTGERYTFVPGGAGSFGPEINMQQQRMGHADVLLPDGRVLLVGGANGSDPLDPQPELSWQLWDPVFGYTLPGPLNDGRILPTANLLPDGRVFIAGGATGGFTSPVSVGTTEIWDPSNETSTPAAPLAQHRAGHQSLSLPDGTVLLSGGGTGTGVFQSGLTSIELYQP